MTKLSTSARGSIALTNELARGGEGAVSEIAGDAKLLAKIYLKAPSHEKVSKLKAMILIGSGVKPGLAAWPLELVHSGSTVVGFLMSRVAGKQDAHHLYSPKSRAAAFPEANFKFLTHVSLNLANAFRAVHELGVIIGDVNHGSTLVGGDGTVSLIDCDSFQFSDTSRTYSCDVGTPLYLPPELQNQPLRGRRRDENSDRFGLAVLLFHLLFMGRHPFAGVYSGPEEMPIEKAIAQGRFAYGKAASQFKMKRPPGTLTLDTHGPEIAGLFEKAFAPLKTGGLRPSPKDWAIALKSLSESLIVCTESSSHHYHRELKSCPWCTLEAAAPIRLFGHKFTTAPSGSTNVEALWTAIASIPAPQPTMDPRPRDYRPPPQQASNSFRTGRKILAILAAIIGLGAYQLAGLVGGIIFAIVIWPRIDAAKLTAANATLSAASQRSRDLWLQWDSKAKGGAFSTQRSALEKSANALRKLPMDRINALQALEAKKRDLQLAKYLDKFEIAKAGVPLIGLSRATTLASHGIETAADIDPGKIATIPGFGPKMAANLVAWKAQRQRDFRFDPSQPTDPRDIAEVERQFFEKRSKLVKELERGPNLLRQLAAESLDAQRRLRPALEIALAAEDAAYQAVAQL